jgi:uncharacterized protein DUF3987
MTAHAFDPSTVPPADDPLAKGEQMDPEPLVGELAPERPYPIDALPDVMRAAVVEYQAFGQQPVALVATSALSSVSLAAQHLADVQRGPELSGPISVNTLTIAVSGERKTSADRACTSGLRAHEDAMCARAGEDLIRHRVAMMDYKLRHDALEARLKEARKGKATGKGVDAIIQALEDLNLAAPVAPPERVMFHSDSYCGAPGAGSRSRLAELRRLEQRGRDHCRRALHARRDRHGEDRAPQLPVGCPALSAAPGQGRERRAARRAGHLQHHGPADRVPALGEPGSCSPGRHRPSAPASTARRRPACRRWRRSKAAWSSWRRSSRG